MLTYDVKPVSHDEYSAALAEIEDQLESSVSFLQSPAYAKLQVAAGKEVVCITITNKDKLVGCGVGVRYTAPGKLAYLYFPYGPVVTDCSQELLAALKGALQPIAQRLGCTFVRIDNTRLITTTGVSTATNAVARMSSLQPRIEWVLPIHEPLDTIWMGMHKHARYNVRLAERANATFETYVPSEAPLDTFYEL
ncbi:MAG: peptidoglycan bridge formation glycyltransferase FemA/FemB family protein, partial [Candidatus Saccharimonadales bacterium]